MLKYRQPVFTTAGLEIVEKAFKEVAKKMNFQLLDFNGEGDHIHCLLEYPSKLAVSKMVNSLKGVSSRRYGQANLLKPKGKPRCGVLRIFAVSVGGAPIEILKEYIDNQKKPS